ncbi:mucin-4-like [Diorhabda carinulata]|uniref:mucin-4-like n=1 Tax=Diorhabda carinulata TaxID=1163345 RepID=UPI0025A00958|nr:mucin-4-like [Diorhabda carinulata]
MENVLHYIVVILILGQLPILSTSGDAISKRVSFNNVEDFKDVVEFSDSNKNDVKTEDSTVASEKKPETFESHNVWPLSRVKTDVNNVQKSQISIKNKKNYDKLSNSDRNNDIYVVRKLGPSKGYFFVEKRHKPSRKQIKHKRNWADSNNQLVNGENRLENEKNKEAEISNCKELFSIFDEIPLIQDKIKQLLEKKTSKRMSDTWKSIKLIIMNHPEYSNNHMLDKLETKRCFQNFVNNQRRKRHSTYINLRNQKKKINNNLAKRNIDDDPRFKNIINFIVKNRMFSDKYTYVPIMFAKVENCTTNYTTENTTNNVNYITTNNDIESSTNLNNSTSMNVNVTKTNELNSSTTSSHKDIPVELKEKYTMRLKLEVPEEDTQLQYYDDDSMDSQVDNSTFKTGNPTSSLQLTNKSGNTRSKKNITKLNNVTNTDSNEKVTNCDTNNTEEEPITLALTYATSNSKENCENTTLNNISTTYNVSTTNNENGTEPIVTQASATNIVPSYVATSTFSEIIDKVTVQFGKAKGNNEINNINIHYSTVNVTFSLGSSNVTCENTTRNIPEGVSTENISIDTSTINVSAITSSIVYESDSTSSNVKGINSNIGANTLEKPIPQTTENAVTTNAIKHKIIPGILIYPLSKFDNVIDKNKRNAVDIESDVEEDDTVTIEDINNENNVKYVNFNPFIKEKKSVSSNCSEETERMLDELQKLQLPIEENITISNEDNVTYSGPQIYHFNETDSRTDTTETVSDLITNTTSTPSSITTLPKEPGDNCSTTQPVPIVSASNPSSEEAIDYASTTENIIETKITNIQSLPGLNPSSEEVVGVSEDSVKSAINTNEKINVQYSKNDNTTLNGLNFTSTTLLQNQINVSIQTETSLPPTSINYTTAPSCESIREGYQNITSSTAGTTNPTVILSTGNVLASTTIATVLNQSISAVLPHKNRKSVNLKIESLEQDLQLVNEIQSILDGVFDERNGKKFEIREQSDKKKKKNWRKYEKEEKEEAEAFVKKRYGEAFFRPKHAKLYVEFHPENIYYDVSENSNYLLEKREDTTKFDFSWPAWHHTKRRNKNWRKMFTKSLKRTTETDSTKHIQTQTDETNEETTETSSTENTGMSIQSAPTEYTAQTYVDHPVYTSESTFSTSIEENEMISTSSSAYFVPLSTVNEERYKNEEVIITGVINIDEITINTEATINEDNSPTRKDELTFVTKMLTNETPIRHQQTTVEEEYSIDDAITINNDLVNTDETIQNDTDLIEDAMTIDRAILGTVTISDLLEDVEDNNRREKLFSKADELLKEVSKDASIRTTETTIGFPKKATKHVTEESTKIVEDVNYEDVVPEISYSDKKTTSKQSQITEYEHEKRTKTKKHDRYKGQENTTTLKRIEMEEGAKNVEGNQGIGSTIGEMDETTKNQWKNYTIIGKVTNSEGNFPETMQKETKTSITESREELITREPVRTEETTKKTKKSNSDTEEFTTESLVLEEDEELLPSFTEEHKKISVSTAVVSEEVMSTEKLISTTAVASTNTATQKGISKVERFSKQSAEPEEDEELMPSFTKEHKEIIISTAAAPETKTSKEEKISTISLTSTNKISTGGAPEKGMLTKGSISTTAVAGTNIKTQKGIIKIEKFTTETSEPEEDERLLPRFTKKHKKVGTSVGGAPEKEMLTKGSISTTSVAGTNVNTQKGIIKIEKFTTETSEPEEDERLLPRFTKKHKKVGTSVGGAPEKEMLTKGSISTTSVAGTNVNTQKGIIKIEKFTTETSEPEEDERLLPGFTKKHKKVGTSVGGAPEEEMLTKGSISTTAVAGTNDNTQKGIIKIEKFTTETSEPEEDERLLPGFTKKHKKVGTSVGGAPEEEMLTKGSISTTAVAGTNIKTQKGIIKIEKFTTETSEPEEDERLLPGFTKKHKKVVTSVGGAPEEEMLTKESISTTSVAGTNVNTQKGIIKIEKFTTETSESEEDERLLPGFTKKHKKVGTSVGGAPEEEMLTKGSISTTAVAGTNIKTQKGIIKIEKFTTETSEPEEDERLLPGFTKKHKKVGTSVGAAPEKGIMTKGSISTTAVANTNIISQETPGENKKLNTLNYSKFLESVNLSTKITKEAEELMSVTSPMEEMSSTEAEVTLGGINEEVATLSVLETVSIAWPKQISSTLEHDEDWEEESTISIGDLPTSKSEMQTDTTQQVITTEEDMFDGSKSLGTTYHSKVVSAEIDNEVTTNEEELEKTIEIIEGTVAVSFEPKETTSNEIRTGGTVLTEVEHGEEENGRTGMMTNEITETISETTEMGEETEIATPTTRKHDIESPETSEVSETFPEMTEMGEETEIVAAPTREHKIGTPEATEVSETFSETTEIVEETEIATAATRKHEIESPETSEVSGTFPETTEMEAETGIVEAPTTEHKIESPEAIEVSETISETTEMEEETEIIAASTREHKIETPEDTKVSETNSETTESEEETKIIAASTREHKIETPEDTEVSETNSETTESEEETKIIAASTREHKIETPEDTEVSETISETTEMEGETKIIAAATRAHKIETPEATEVSETFSETTEFEAETRIVAAATRKQKIETPEATELSETVSATTESEEETEIVAASTREHKIETPETTESEEETEIVAASTREHKIGSPETTEVSESLSETTESEEETEIVAVPTREHKIETSEATEVSEMFSETIESEVETEITTESEPETVIVAASTRKQKIETPEATELSETTESEAETELVAASTREHKIESPEATEVSETFSETTEFEAETEIVAAATRKHKIETPEATEVSETFSEMTESEEETEITTESEEETEIVAASTREHEIGSPETTEVPESLSETTESEEETEIVAVPTREHKIETSEATEVSEMFSETIESEVETEIWQHLLENKRSKLRKPQSCLRRQNPKQKRS